MTNITAVQIAAEKEFGIAGRIVKQENWWHLYLTNNGDNPIIKWFQSIDIFDKRSYEKTIPDFVFSLPLMQIAFFLSHLWATDGNLSPASEGGMAIYYATTSKMLAHQVQHLLLRLGILSSIQGTRKQSYRNGFIVDISGKTEQQKFLNEVGVFSKETQCLEAKEHLADLKVNPNLDVIPKEIWLEIEKVRKSSGLSSREFHRKLGWAYSGTQRQHNGISRQRLTSILRVANSQLLLDLVNSDIFWDEVKEIIPDGKEEVFDATVRGAHNFLANDIIVHNSIEQDADVVMFLYRPEENKDLAPSDKIPTTLSIDKHRNGPLIEIPLMLHASHQQFRLVAKG